MKIKQVIARSSSDAKNLPLPPSLQKRGDISPLPFSKGGTGRDFTVSTNHKVTALLGLVISLTTFLSGNIAHAFYSSATNNAQFEANGFFALGQTALDESDTPTLFTPDENAITNAGFRLMTQARFGAAGFDASLAHGWSSAFASSVAAFSSSPERSGSLGWNDTSHRMAFDRLAYRWSNDRVQLKLGRQPVNLATTFFFAPTDFFSPFAAQSFFRVYKPGVDAARADMNISDLSQLTLVTVAGYEPDPESDTGWSDSIDSKRTSWLLRLNRGSDAAEWSLLGGKVRRDNVAGAGLQTELFDWLGVRAEAVILHPLDAVDNYSARSLGLEHRWENSFELRGEHYRNSTGANDSSEYVAQLQSPAFLDRAVQLPYLASEYTALSASYEFTPLLVGQALAIYNHIDHSKLYAFYATWSLTDNAEMSFSTNFPDGSADKFPLSVDEFGLYPKSLNIEFRVYF